MRARTLRRAAERAASKLASAASISVQPDVPVAAPPSPARIAANQANAKLSTGPGLAGIAASCHTIHGLARHNKGTFKLLTSEDPVGFEAFKQSLLDEHQATTPTESILVTAMVESHWLAQRAQRLHDTCLNHRHHQSIPVYAPLNDLIKLRSERRKANIGFEAQKHQTERHEMAKTHPSDRTFRKDMKAQRDLTDLVLATTQATRDIPGFEAKYMAARPPNGAARVSKQAVTVRLNSPKLLHPRP